jgi:DNA-binding NarL/FixJ family response regulator
MEACILYDVGRSSLLEHPSLAAEKRKNRATALLYEALEISVQLGMRPLTERINDLLTQKMPSDTLPDRFMEVLTNREREVATCLERGLSNKEIAETLNISVHTVINHIRHILEKTGTSSRGAAVAALKRAHSLFSDQTRS